VTANTAELTSLKIASGRELTDFDDEYRRPVCIIGADVADYLFPDRDPAGQTIKVGAADYQVIGVAASRGSSFGASQDGFIQLPLGTFNKVFGTRSRSVSLIVKARPNASDSPDPLIEIDRVEDLARFGMRQVHKLQPGQPDDFSVTTAKSVEAFAGRITGIIAIVLYPLTGIALGVAGIVVMNMMLASVTERTREIGIRLSIGARRKDILAQFLIESTLLTLSGGLVGVLIAVVLVWLASKITGFPLSVPLWALSTALIMSSTVGLVFGVVPARRASKLDPIEALRKE
jgi:putative ABC transport system permease protein